MILQLVCIDVNGKVKPGGQSALIVNILYYFLVLSLDHFFKGCHCLARSKTKDFVRLM